MSNRGGERRYNGGAPFFVHVVVVLLIWSQIFGPLLPSALAADEKEKKQVEESSDPTEVSPSPDRNLPAEGDALHEAIESGKGNSLDTFDLLRQTVQSYSSPNRIGVNLTVEIRPTAGGAPTLIYARDAGRVAPISFGAGHSFSIQWQGKSILSFTHEVAEITFYGNYLIFREQGSFDSSTGVQNVKFLDLSEFRYNLGRSEIPVYRIPVQTGSEGRLSFEADQLKVGDTSLPLKVVDHFAYVQQMAFNLTASLADPKTFEETKELVGELDMLFQKATELAGRDMEVQAKAVTGSPQMMEDFLKQLKEQVKQRQDLVKALNENKPTAEGESASKHLMTQFGLQLDQATQFQKSVNSIAATQAAQTRLFARIRLLWARLTLPKPDGAPKIKEALFMVAGAFSGKLQGEAARRAKREGALQLIHHPYIKYGAPVVAVATLGMLSPQFAEYLYGVMDLTRAGLGTLLGNIERAGSLAWDAMNSTLKGFNPYTFHQRYLSGENLPRFLTGLTAAFTTLFCLLGIPHLMVNGYRLAQDLWNKEPSEQAGGPRLSLYQRFIARQNRVQTEYLQSLADDEAKESGKEKKTYTADEDVEIKGIIAELKKKDATWFGKGITAIRECSLYKRLFQKTATQIETFRGALMHLLFSAASFTISGYAYARIWNVWFGLRSFVWHPILCLSFLAYPTYFSTATRSQRGLTLPTHLNGGLRPLPQATLLKVRELFGSETAVAMKAWEAKIIPVEAAIQKAALRKSFTALVRFLDDPETLKKVLASGGIDKLTDNTLYELSGAQRRFFLAYFNAVKDEAMRQFLDGVAGTEAGLDIENRTVEELKAATLRQIDKIEITPEGAAEIVGKITSDGKLYDQVRDATESPSLSLSRAENWLNQRNMRFLDPDRNRQVSRMQTVNRQLQKPQAMARAVRGTIASMIVDKPMELMLLFVCLAGVTSGINIPLHSEAFSADSWFYLGRYPLLTGYMTGVVTGILANIWMKIQQDEMHDGQFGKVPEGNDKDISYTGWFWKKFRDPSNSWKKNYVHYVKIIWANMPAALAMMLVTNVITLGRLDFDMYLLGYMVAYAIAPTAILWKLEQAFELASGWFKKFIPEKYHQHPEAQAYLNARVGRARIVFNIWQKFLENVVEFYQVTFLTIGSIREGPRAFSRLLFGGFTPTEVAISFFEKVKDLAGAIPGVKPVANFCVRVITNNYTSFKPQ